MNQTRNNNKRGWFIIGFTTIYKNSRLVYLLYLSLTIILPHWVREIWTLESPHTHTHFLKIIHMIWIIYDLNMKHMNRISESCVNFNHKDFAWLYSFMFIWQRVELVVDALRLVMGSSCPMIFNGLLWLLTPTPTYGVFFPMSNWYEAFLIFLAWVKHGCNGSKIRLALTGKYVTLLEESHPMYLRSSQTVYTDQWGHHPNFFWKNIKNTQYPLVN